MTTANFAQVGIANQPALDPIPTGTTVSFNNDKSNVYGSLTITKPSMKKQVQASTSADISSVGGALTYTEVTPAMVRTVSDRVDNPAQVQV
jgi:hypothetical protein